MNLSDPKIVIAIENVVCGQLEASGINADPFRLDGEKIIDVILEQLENFVLVPKEISIDDARKHAETMFNKVEQMARHEHRDLNEIEFEAFKNRWLEARTLTIQHDWNAMIEVQEQVIRSS